MGASRRVTASVGAADTWSGPLVARIGSVYVRAGGAFLDYVTVQRSHDDGATWEAVTHLPPGAAPRNIHNAVQGAWFRAGFGTYYASGDADIGLAQ